jgi:hypothetical protein
LEYASSRTLCNAERIGLEQILNARSEIASDNGRLNMPMAINDEKARGSTEMRALSLLKVSEGFADPEDRRPRITDG